MIRGVLAELRKLACPEIVGGILAVPVFAVVFAAFGIRRASHWGIEAQTAASTLSTPSGALLGSVHQHVSIGGAFLAALLVAVSLVDEYRSGMLPINLLFAPGKGSLLARKLVAMFVTMVASIAVTAVALWAVAGGLVTYRYQYFAQGAVTWTESIMVFGRSTLVLLFFLTLVMAIGVGTKSMVPTMVVGFGLLSVTVPLVTVRGVVRFLPQNWIATWVGLENPWQFLTYFWARADGDAGLSGLILTLGTVLLAAGSFRGFIRGERLSVEE